jgi:hypothetical protein
MKTEQLIEILESYGDVIHAYQYEQIANEIKDRLPKLSNNLIGRYGDAQFEQSDLRSELIKFCNETEIESYIYVEKVVDEYLKTKP